MNPRVCERSTSVGAAGRRRPRLRPVTGHPVNGERVPSPYGDRVPSPYGERWVPFTVPSNPVSGSIAACLMGQPNFYARCAAPFRNLACAEDANRMF
eukprot:365604-Chlamydomonas_euryale.AAC.8